MSIAPSTFTPTPPAEELEWQYRPQDDVAHAFLATNGPGWLRAKCRKIPLTIALVDAPASFPRCPDCLAIVGASESELRAMHGDR